MGPEPLRKIMTLKVSREYRLHQDSKSSSDDTILSSLMRAKGSLSTARREQVLSMLATRARKYGGTRLEVLEGFLSEARDGGLLSKKESGDSEPDSEPDSD